MVPKTNKSVFWIWILNWTLPSPYQYISSMVPHPHWHLKVSKEFLLFIYFEQCIFPCCDVVYVNLLLSYFHNMALDKLIVFINDMTDIFVRSFAVSNMRLLWTSKHTKLQTWQQRSFLWFLFFHVINNSEKSNTGHDGEFWCFCSSKKHCVPHFLHAINSIWLNLYFPETHFHIQVIFCWGKYLDRSAYRPI